MTTNSKLKFVFLIVAVTCSQLVFAQQAQSDVTPQSLLTNSVQGAKPANKARVIIEWATVDWIFGISKTKISVDKSVVCELNKENAKICDISVEPGKREIELENNADYGTYSEQFNLEAGKRYQIEVVTNKKNFLVDTLFSSLPISFLVNEKGKNSNFQFKLVNVSAELNK
jgi:hypothetical protein